VQRLQQTSDMWYHITAEMQILIYLGESCVAVNDRGLGGPRAATKRTREDCFLRNTRRSCQEG
jgi:hypothetical protein